MPFVPDAQPATTGFIPDLPPPVPPPRPQNPFALAEAPAALPTLGPQPQPLPPPATPGPGLSAPQWKRQQVERLRNRKEALQPDPVMQSALEGASIGGVLGGSVRAAAMTAAQMAAGGATAERVRSHIQRLLPQDTAGQAVGRWLLDNLAFIAPGLGFQLGGAWLRNRPTRPPWQEWEHPPVAKPAAAPVNLREGAVDAEIVPEQQPRLAIAGPVGGGGFVPDEPVGAPPVPKPAAGPSVPAIVQPAAPVASGEAVPELPAPEFRSSGALKAGPTKTFVDEGGALPDIKPEGTGKTVTVFGAEPGVTYETRYRVVPLDKLKTNAKDLQPRDRNRAASRQQVDTIARNLDAAQYFAGQEYLDRGASIIGPDLKVESGNGRIEGIRRAKQSYPERYAAFAEQQRARAQELGIDPRAFEGIKDPVIVRERLTSVPDRMAFAEEANVRSGLGMGTAETAEQDARNLSPNVVDAMEIGESQSVEQALSSPRNAAVVRAFMESVPAAERAALLAADGSGLTPAGAQRMKAALLARAFPGEAGKQLTRAFLESTDTGVRSVESGLFAALPHLVKAEELIAAGARPAVSLTEDVAKAVGVLARLRATGMRIDDYLSQQTLGGRELTSFQEQLLAELGQAKSVKQIREPLIRYATLVRELPPTGQGGFAGMDAAPPTAEQLWARAKKDPQAGLFGSEKGSFLLPKVLAERAKQAREQAISIGKGLSPTAWATDEALNAIYGARGEEIETNRFQYNQLSRGNEAFWDRVIGKQGVGEVRKFMGRLSRGEPQPTPELQRMADFYRNADDAAAFGASRFKRVPYLENHFPGLFTKPEDAERWFQASGRRPMQGTQGFFNKKKWRDFEEAVKPKELGGGGLEPVSWNPEVLWRTYLEDVRKFTGARAWFESRKASGALTWRPQNAPMPVGKAAIEDSITKRYFPPDAVPVVIKRENLQAALKKYVQTLTRITQRLSETTRTTGGATKADGSPTNIGKIEARVREALTSRGFSTGEADQMIGRLQTAGATGKDAAQEVIREITERVKTIEKTTSEVMNLPPEVWLQGRVATQRFIPAGEWVVDENEARVINNILSRDFIRMHPGLRAALLLNAKMNALQLGFSAFHVTTEFGNAWSTKMGHIARAALAGKPLRTLGQIARLPTAPIEQVIRGHLYWKDPAMIFDTMSPLRHGMQLTKPTGAFAPGTALETFLKHWRRHEPGGVVKNAFGAMVDATMAPIFQYMVPRMKVGAYLDILSDEFNRHAEGIADGTINPSTLARQVVEQVDNRMGMVNYDLWAWNHTFRTMMQLFMRAPGWNFGYGKAGVQGMADIARGRFTPAAQFVVGTVMATTLGAAIYQYLHTEKPIENVTDILFPRNGQVDAEGNELRIRFPGPLKDAWGLTHDLVGTLFNKASPGFTTLWRAFAPETFGGNRDFFGDYIRNKADPLPEQGKQFLGWLLREVSPFSLQQYGKIKGVGHEYPEGQLPPMPAATHRINEQEIESYLGATKAPHEVIIGPQRRELETLMQQHTRKQGPRTQEQKAMDDRKRVAQEEIRAGGVTPELDKLVEEGAFPNRQVLRQFILNAQRSSTEKLTRKIPKRFRPTPLPDLGQTVP